MLIYRGDYAYGFLVVGDGPDFGDPQEQRPLQIYPGGTISIYWPTDKSEPQHLVTSVYPAVYALSYGNGIVAFALSPDDTAKLKLSKNADDRQDLWIVFDDPSYQLKRSRKIKNKLIIMDRVTP